MLIIRLQRVGRVHEPSFRLVLTDSQHSTKSGRFKEILGSYDPRKTTDSLNVERIKYWLEMGAKTTATVHNLLVKHKIIQAKKIDVSATSKKKKDEEKKEGTEVKPEKEPAEETPTEKADQETKQEEKVEEPAEKGV